MNAVNPRHPSIEKSIALIYITDPNFLEREKGSVLVGDYSKDGYRNLKTPVVFENEAFDFKLSFAIIHKVRVQLTPNESCEATLLRFDNGDVFDIQLNEDSSLIECMTLEETERFIQQNIKITNNDNYKAIKTALTLSLATICR